MARLPALEQPLEGGDPSEGGVAGGAGGQGDRLTVGYLSKQGFAVRPRGRSEDQEEGVAQAVDPFGPQAGGPLVALGGRGVEHEGLCFRASQPEGMGGV